jgi:hypothetical protein
MKKGILQEGGEDGSMQGTGNRGRLLSHLRLGPYGCIFYRATVGRAECRGCSFRGDRSGGVFELPTQVVAQQ